MQNRWEKFGFNPQGIAKGLGKINVLTNGKYQIISPSNIDISFPELSGSAKIKMHSGFDRISRSAQGMIEKLRYKWEPIILFQWFNFDFDDKQGLGKIIKNSGESIDIDLGESKKFIKPAKNVIVGICSIGEEIDSEYERVMKQGGLLDAYFIDLIGLIALDKTISMLKKIVENQAQILGWGVSPFLSPGSSPGWNIEEQTRLCKLLPMDKIKVKMTEDGMLSPLKSNSALIGIGPDYSRKKVGNTCDLCSNRENCQIKRHLSHS